MLFEGPVRSLLFQPHAAGPHVNFGFCADKENLYASFSCVTGRSKHSSVPGLTEVLFPLLQKYARPELKDLTLPFGEFIIVLLCESLCL